MNHSATFSQKTRGRNLAILSVLFAAVALAACGGGGGAPAPAPSPAVSKSVTCPNGTSSTGQGADDAAAVAAANTACPAAKVLSISPTDAATGIDTTTLSAVEVETDSTLDGSSITDANVNLKNSGTTIVGTVSTSSVKGFKFTPSSKLDYNKSYAFTASVKDGVGKGISVSSNFTTANWWPAKNVTQMGVVTLGTSMNQLPAGCTSVNQACFKDFVASGKALTLKSTATMVGLVKADGSADPRATREISFVSFIGSTGKHQTLMFYADTGELFNIAGDVDVLWSGRGYEKITGNASGFLFKENNTGVCYQWRWNPPGSSGSRNVWDSLAVTCPF